VWPVISDRELGGLYLAMGKYGSRTALPASNDVRREPDRSEARIYIVTLENSGGYSNLQQYDVRSHVQKSHEPPAK